MQPTQQKLSQAVQHLRRVKCWERDNHHLKPPDVALEILLTISIAKAETVILKQLYASLPCTMPTAVKWIKRLNIHGWVVIGAHDADKRMRKATLTDAARKFLFAYYETQGVVGKIGRKINQRGN